ncbi:SOS response-associated peptidase [Daejeonella lutea]|uniref:Abasic site processing protein n=1 Tax=Daejeonella lutea TaxID=572036 RepID=A0A1T5EHD2_9SPHI|nr:SOS response-associated peptidase [Daejeonella lutea]SKB83160.1 SOS response associated peptidase (SRAP) [Daejeonella lutea]
MCYHAQQKASAKKLQNDFKRTMINTESYEEQHHSNGFSHKNFAVIANIEGVDALHLFNWGLIPFWVKTTSDARKLSNNTLNAKSETIFDLASFKTSISSKRCVIPLTGFYESRDIDGVKYPYFIYPRNSDYFLVGGIYSSWKNKDTDETIKTFSIITTPSNELMTQIHNVKQRMPLILKQSDVDTWIDPTLPRQSIIDLMQPHADEEMAAYTVSKDVNSSKVQSDRNDITTRIDYEGVSQFC